MIGIHTQSTTRKFSAIHYLRLCWHWYADSALHLLPIHQMCHIYKYQVHNLAWNSVRCTQTCRKTLNRYVTLKIKFMNFEKFDLHGNRKITFWVQGSLFHDDKLNEKIPQTYFMNQPSAILLHRQNITAIIAKWAIMNNFRTNLCMILQLCSNHRSNSQANHVIVIIIAQ